jgi:hypothetical protein
VSCVVSLRRQKGDDQPLPPRDSISQHRSLLTSSPQFPPGPVKSGNHRKRKQQEDDLRPPLPKSLCSTGTMHRFPSSDTSPPFPSLPSLTFQSLDPSLRPRLLGLYSLPSILALWAQLVFVVFCSRLSRLSFGRSGLFFVRLLTWQRFLQGNAGDRLA